MTDKYPSYSNSHPRSPPRGPRRREPPKFSDRSAWESYYRADSYDRPADVYRPRSESGRYDEHNMNKRPPSRSPEGSAARKAPRASPRELETPNSPASSSTAAGQDLTERRRSRPSSIERDASLSARRRSYADSPTNKHLNGSRTADAADSADAVPVVTDPRQRNRTASVPVAPMLPIAQPPATVTDDKDASDTQNPFMTMLLQFGDQVANVAKLELSRDQGIAKLKRAKAEQVSLKPSFVQFPAFKEQSENACRDAQNNLDRLQTQLASHRTMQAEIAQTLATAMQRNEAHSRAASQSYVTREDFEDSQLKVKAVTARCRAAERKGDSLETQLSNTGSRDAIQQLQDKTYALENKLDTMVENEAKTLMTAHKAEPTLDQATKDKLCDGLKEISALTTTVAKLKSGQESLSALVCGSEEGELDSSQRTAQELGGSMFESLKSMKARVESVQTTKTRLDTALNNIQLLKNVVIDGDTPLTRRVKALDDFAFKGDESAKRKLEHLATTMNRLETALTPEGGQSLLARVNQLKQNVASMEKTVGSLREERNTSRQTSIATSGEAIVQIEARIASIEDAINDLRNDLDDRKESLGEEFLKIDSKLAELRSSLTLEVDVKLRQANKPTVNGTGPARPQFVAPPNRNTGSPFNGIIPTPTPENSLTVAKKVVDEIMQLRARCDGMSTALASLKTRYDNLTTDALAQQMLNQLGREAANIEKVRTEFRQLHQHADTGFQRLTNTAEATMSEVNKLRTSLVGLSNKLDKHVEEHAGEIFSSNSRTDALDSSIGEQAKSMVWVHAKLNETKEALEKSKEEVESLKAEVGSIKDVTGTLKTDMSSTRGGANALKKEVGSMREELDALDTETSNIKEVLDNHQVLLDYGEREIPRMQKQLDQTTDDVGQLRTQVAIFKAEQKVAKQGREQGQDKAAPK